MTVEFQIAGSTLTAQQPEVNVVRTTVQALAAVLGGTQSLHTNSMDEALGLPTENAARVALRTQQVIAHESGVADTVDPLAGSYAIEELTTQLEERAAQYIEKIDQMGGMLRAIESGYPQREIQEAAYQYQRAVETHEAIVVGVNKFQLGSPPYEGGVAAALGGRGGSLLVHTRNFKIPRRPKMKPRPDIYHHRHICRQRLPCFRPNDLPPLRDDRQIHLRRFRQLRRPRTCAQHGRATLDQTIRRFHTTHTSALYAEPSHIDTEFETSPAA
jgi:hypothetical protein